MTPGSHKARLILAIALALAVVGGGLALWATSSRGKVAAVPPAPSVSATHGPPLPTHLEHIFVIMDENKDYSQVIGVPAMPYLNSLATKYTVATNFGFETHPSLPNYIALTSGSMQGITNDCNPPAGCQVNARNLADSLESAGVSWKEYAEDMPRACASTNAGDYATKHVPFLYYADILGNPARCQSHVVPLTNLQSDLGSAGTAPAFAFITPNLCNDAHDCPLSAADSWLAREVPAILSSKAFKSGPSLLVITFDESNGSAKNIATVLAGPTVKSGFQDPTSYNHYSLLRTIEDNWGLPPLTANDAAATPMTNSFK
jgi:phospholipase C